MKKKTKGKQHAARSESFKRIAKQLREYARYAANPEQSVRMVAAAFEKEAERLGAILR